MTVAELIEKLKQQPQDKEVAVYDSEYNYFWEVTDITLTQICKDRTSHYKNVDKYLINVHPDNRLFIKDVIQLS